ncbi:ski oncogene-like [Amphibalanus amphitrite]|uniref:ski oncogene-like n=1 Tax=Amphibalanus amphitrite TaxID=1232801 RepID=UPI001C903336|nr:ski oncogene-like [Amphibalanus amphitrite]
MMETVNGRYSLQPDQYSPHIKRVLKSYRSSAMDSLSGPREFTHFKREANASDDDCVKPNATITSSKSVSLVNVPKATSDKRVCDLSSDASGVKQASSDSDSPRECSPSPPRIPFPPPILSAPDQAWGEVSETWLEGETISCFSVGGEKRLCLPQVLNSVLRGVSISQIHGVCDELHIFCSTCSKEQLDVLKKSGILPPSASQCGLITKTDAERLCSELLNGSAPQLLKSEYELGTANQRMDVHHKCFGKCRGTLRLELYTSPPAPCIECNECRGLFAPIKFASHTHENRETRTVHWGFDSSKWRNYLLLCPGQADMETKEALFKEFKNKFDLTLKRKQPPADEAPDEKRCKLEEPAAAAGGPGALLYPIGLPDPALLYRWHGWPYVAALPRLLPPPPTAAHTVTKDTPHSRSFLSHDPPVLLHPDRVVKNEDAKQHERHFQPNVALAPHKSPPTSEPAAPPPAAATAAPKARAADSDAAELLSNLDSAVARVSALVGPLPAGDRVSVVDTVRALADAVTRLRAENKQKTTLLEERTAHLRDLMVTQQKDAAARQARTEVEDANDEKTAVLDCSRRTSPQAGSTPVSTVGE